jgi:streptogramin lyase
MPRPHGGSPARGIIAQTSVVIALFTCPAIARSEPPALEVAPIAEEERAFAPTPLDVELDSASPVPSLAILGTSVAEGDGRRREMRFRLKVSRPMFAPVTARWRTEDGTATAADGDYVPAAGTVTVYPGTYVYQSVFLPYGLSVNITRLAVDRQQNLYITDHYNGTVHRYDPYGAYVKVWGGRGSTLGKFSTPINLAIGADGLLRVADTGNNRIVFMTRDGAFLGEMPLPINGSNETVFDAAGNIWVGGHGVRKFDPQGRLVASFPHIAALRGMAVDGAGNLFVGGEYGVGKYDSTGALVASFGGRGLPPDGLDRVQSLVLDASGNVYVSQQPGWISMFDNSGRFIRRWGEPGTAPGQLSRPAYMTIDHAGNLYVYDHNDHPYNNDRIQKFRLQPASAEVAVEVRSDLRREGDETFRVRVVEATHSVIVGAVATGTIVDDDSLATAPHNVAGNPSFEGSLDGWRAYGTAVIERTTEDAHDGIAALRVSGLAPRSYSGVNDSPDAVRAVREAGPHRFAAWVRSAGFRGRVRLRVREYFEGATVGSWWSDAVDLGDDWRMVALDVPASRVGATLDFNVLHDPFSGPPPGGAAEAFLVDDVRITAPGRRDEAPIVTAPTDLLAYVGFPVEIDVTVDDPDGQPVESLVADASRLPSGAGARLVSSVPLRGGRWTWTPTDRDVLLEPHTVTFTASNALSDWARTRLLVAPVSWNYFRNPTFPNSSWWKSYLGAAIEAVPLEGRDGDGALRVSGTGPGEYGVNDEGYQVRGLPAGTMLLIGAWVKSPEHRGAVRIRLREYSPEDVLLGDVVYSTPATTGPEWRHLLLRHVTRGAQSNIDVQITAKPVVAGESFLLDDVQARLVFLPPGAGPDGAAPMVSRESPSPLAAVAVPLELGARVFPNPARGAATLALTLPIAGPMRAEVFDASGRRVRTLADESAAPAGVRRLEISGTGRALAPGLYFFRVQSIAGVRRGRFVVLE